MRGGLFSGQLLISRIQRQKSPEQLVRFSTPPLFGQKKRLFSHPLKKRRFITGRSQSRNQFQQILDLRAIRLLQLEQDFFCLSKPARPDQNLGPPPRFEIGLAGIDLLLQPAQQGFSTQKLQPSLEDLVGLIGIPTSQTVSHFCDNHLSSQALLQSRRYLCDVARERSSL